MKRTITLSIALIGVLFFTSCEREESINIDQNRIYSQYTHTYNANSNQSQMTATFRLDNSGGKKLELTYPSRVDFNGEGMAWRNAMGYYDLKISGNSQNGVFNYHDLDGETFSNNADLVSETELPFGLTTISMSGNFFLPWVGAALKQGEVVRVTIKGGNQSASRSWTVTMPGSTHFILDSNKLSQLTPGTAEIQIEREMEKSLVSSNLAGGRISSKYLSRKIQITIAN